MNAESPEKLDDLLPVQPIDAVVIGASAGAVEALSAIIRLLPSHFRLPILLVVHSPPQRDNALVDIFRPKCHSHFKEAEDKEPIKPGTIYCSPPDYHLLVEQDRCLALSSEEPVWYCRPSIDVLFESAAEIYGPALAGVILTGANEDGARGLRAVCQAGGIGLVQDPASAKVPTMPRAALDLCPSARTLTLAQIARLLVAVDAPLRKEPR